MSGRATAIILGRAGSKGLPGKNAADVGGRPCIAWTIIDAIGSESIDRVVVSSDSDELLSIAEAMGVEAVERPRALATDDATVDDAARHAAASARVDSDALALLYANVPVRPAGLIDRAIAMLERTGCDSVQSYARVGKHHPWWMARVDDVTGIVTPWEGAVLNHGCHRRQDLPPAYLPDGGVIAVRREALEAARAEDGPHAFLGRDRRGVATEADAVVDIDNAMDAAVADAVLWRRRSGAMQVEAA